MADFQKVSEHLRAIRPDYAWDPSIFQEDADDRADAVRCIIEKHLSTVDRTIILLYIDCQSYRELGRLLGFSQTTAFKEVKRVKRKILDIYNGKI